MSETLLKSVNYELQIVSNELYCIFIEASYSIVIVHRALLPINKSPPPHTHTHPSIKTKLFKRYYQKETEDPPQDFGRKWA